MSPRQVSILGGWSGLIWLTGKKIYLISSCLFLVSRCLLKKRSHMEKRELLLGNDCVIFISFSSICKDLSLVYKHERVGIKKHMETTHYLFLLLWKFNLMKRNRRIFFPLTNHKKADLILHFSCENQGTEHPTQISFSLINCTSPQTRTLSFCAHGIKCWIFLDANLWGHFAVLPKGKVTQCPGWSTGAIKVKVGAGFFHVTRGNLG